MSGYTPEALEICKKVVRSINAESGVWGPKCVVIGGLVPALLGIEPPEGLPPHIGTTDVDLGIDIAAVHEEPDLYRTLKSVMKALNFSQSGEDPSFCWKRVVDGVPVKLELFCPATAEGQIGIQRKPFGEAGSGLTAFAVLGLDLVERDKVIANSEGELLDGRGIKSVNVTVCGLASFILLKAWALEQRTKDKDGYDVIWCLRAEGPEKLAELYLRARFHQEQVGAKALTYLERNFETPDHTGPVGWVTEAGFSGEDLLREKRDAVGLVHEFCRLSQQT